MEETRLLADKFTPAFLMDLCNGLTDFQSRDIVEPFIGKWIRLSGPVIHASPNPQFRTAGVTLDFSTEGKRRDAFLTFTRDLDRLANVSPGEVITAEGKIKSIASHGMTLEHCGLTHPQTIAILEVSAAAKGLQKAIEDRVASGEPITLKPISPPADRRTDDDDNNDGDLPDVDFEHLKLWHAVFAAAYPRSSEKVALASARGMFPGYFVPRQWVRDLRGPQTMGRPMKDKGK